MSRKDKLIEQRNEHIMTLRKLEKELLLLEKDFESKKKVRRENWQYSRKN